MKTTQSFIGSWCSQGSAVLLKWLLALPEMSHRPRDQWLHLQSAVCSKSLETVKLFLHHKSARNPVVFTEACRTGTAAIVRALVLAGMNPCLAPDSGKSYIVAAIKDRNDLVINFLLDQGVKAPINSLMLSGVAISNSSDSSSKSEQK